jgi:hypothetical protein
MKSVSAKARRAYSPKTIDKLSFGQAIELLRALSTPGMARKEKNLITCVRDLL